MEEKNIDEIEKKNAEHAYYLWVEIFQRKAEIAKNFLALGKLFKEFRDKKLYKYFDHNSFQSFLGSPEISMKYKTVASLISIYELYVEKLKVNEELLAQVGHAKLQVIKPVVEKQPQEWLFKAKELSKSDLINEVRIAQKKPEVEYSPKKPEVNPFDYDDYVSFVKAHPCVVCGELKVEAAHFPKTRGAGAPPEWVIPLCAACHREYHADPVDFWIENKDSIMGYFYRLFIRCYLILQGNAK